MGHRPETELALAKLCGAQSVSVSSSTSQQTNITKLWIDLVASFDNSKKKGLGEREIDHWIGPFALQLVNNNPGTGNFQKFLSHLTKSLQALQRLGQGSDVTEGQEAVAPAVDYCCSLLQLAQVLTTRIIGHTTLRTLPSYFCSNLTETSHAEAVENVLVPLAKVLIDCVGNESSPRLKSECIRLLISMTSTAMYHHDESEGSHFCFETLDSLPEAYHFQLVAGLLRCCITGQDTLLSNSTAAARGGQARGILRAGLSFAKNSVRSLWPTQKAASNEKEGALKAIKLQSQCLLLCLIFYQSRSAQLISKLKNESCWGNPWKPMVVKCTNANTASSVSFKAVSGNSSSAPRLVMEISFRSLLQKLGVAQPSSVDYLLLYSFLSWNRDFLTYCVSSKDTVSQLLRSLVQTLSSVGKIDTNLEYICMTILLLLLKERAFMVFLANHDAAVHKEDLWIALLRVFRYHSIRSSDRYATKNCIAMFRMLNDEKIHFASKASQFFLAVLSTVFKSWQKNSQKVELEFFVKALLDLIVESLSASSKPSALLYNLLYRSDLVKGITEVPLFADRAGILQQTVDFFEGKVVGSSQQQLNPQQVQEIIERNTEEWSRAVALPSLPHLDHSYDEYPGSQVLPDSEQTLEWD